jgi:hypothetical protein
LSSLSNPIKYAEIIDDQHHKPTLIIPNKHQSMTLLTCLISSSYLRCTLKLLDINDSIVL